MPKPVVLITGCSSGIGLALAESFQSAGYRVWATARKPADLIELERSGFVAKQLDVTEPQMVSGLVAALTEQEGRLDVLVNNAGYGAMGPLLDGGADALRQQFETNVFAPVALTRECFPLLRKQNGLVINIGSVSGVLVTPYAGAYCASKAAIHAISEALRLELSPFGIGVLEVQPGAIASRFAEHANEQVDRLVSDTSPWWPLRDGIRARARASQDNPTPAATLAEAVIKAVSGPKRPRVLRVGNGSRVLPMLARWIPSAITDALLRKRFGLDVRL